MEMEFWNYFGVPSSMELQLPRGLSIPASEKTDTEQKWVANVLSSDVNRGVAGGNRDAMPHSSPLTVRAEALISVALVSL